MRIEAINIIQKVVSERKSLDQCFTPDTTPKTKEICFGVLRYYFHLEAMTNKLLKKKFKEKDNDIFLLLLIAIYEIQYMKTPEYAVVSESVNTTRTLKKKWAANLVNAILRNHLRQKEKETIFTDDVMFSHPLWLTKKLKQHYPDQYLDIMKNNNIKPPMTLRINQKNLSLENYLEKNSLTGRKTKEVNSAFTLEKPVNISEIPGFFEGDVSVQDAAAQLAAIYLQPKENQRILDACAAPGGKTCHLLEMEPKIKELIALDISHERNKKITENLDRLKLKATVITANAEEPEAWWDNELFDRILLDAPCSATGVIRRHPDIKLLRQESDIKKLPKLQEKLLNKLWPLLKNDGLLLYATCSILPEENTEVIQKFLHEINAELLFSRQILPGEEGMDGFYYALLKKK